MKEGLDRSKTIYRIGLHWVGLKFEDDGGAEDTQFRGEKRRSTTDPKEEISEIRDKRPYWIGLQFHLYARG